MRLRRVCLFSFLLLVSLTTSPLRSQNTPGDRAGGPAQILTADDVAAVITVAATALDNRTMAVAVVDRTGAIVGVYRRPDAGSVTPDVAVTVARAAAMFANDQAPLSSRTVRFISGIHFPPGVRNTGNAALYGVENINRGCAVDDTGDAIFNAAFPRPKSIEGTFGAGAGTLPLPCTPADTRGCARGGPILDLEGAPLASVGITTGKADVRDSGQTSGGNAVPVNPGGIPIYRGGKVIGGVGVAGVPPVLAEYASTLAAAGAGRGMDFSEPLGRPGAVFIDGVRLPFFGTCTTVSCIRASLRTRPEGTAPGRFSEGIYVIQPRDGLQAPEGYVIGPRGSAVAGGLTADEVRRIVGQSVDVAQRTRAMIRLPINQPTRMTIGISDEAGQILGLFRMPDGTVFSSDVAMTKARNAYYFSTRDGYEVLRNYAQGGDHPYMWEPSPPVGRGWAVTARTLSFGGQPLFPPGIDLEEQLHDEEPRPGPWFDLFVFDSKNPCTEGPGGSRGSNRAYLNQSGIVWFPGSVPLYRGDRLIGGLGVSGDGVEQDDYVSFLGSEGFHPPDELRVDNSVIKDREGRIVRLPYLKLPRNPELQ